MRDMAQRGWLQWRVTVAEPAAPVRTRFTRVSRPVLVKPLSNATAEKPGPDGIRHDLVARVKQAIEAGHYDNDEVWEQAQEKLLRDVERQL
jgi:hypothetical protein